MNQKLPLFTRLIVSTICLFICMKAIVNAQTVTCDNTVATATLDLTTYDPSNGAFCIEGNNACCDCQGNKNCLILTVTLPPGAAGFKIEDWDGPSQCSINIYNDFSDCDDWAIECDTNSQGICEPYCAPAGTSTFDVLICKPGNFNQVCGFPEIVPGPYIAPQPDISENCPISLTVDNLIGPVWTSADDPNLDNLTNCAPPGNCGSTIDFLYNEAAIGSITSCTGTNYTYTATGLDASECNTTPISVDGVVTVFPEFTIDAINIECVSLTTLRLVPEISGNAVDLACSLIYDWTTDPNCDDDDSDGGAVASNPDGTINVMNNGNCYCVEVKIDNDIEPCAIQQLCVTADQICCSFSATCDLDPTTVNVEGCDVGVLPNPFTDIDDVFTDVTTEPCAPLVLSHNDVSTGSLCPAGISVERTYTLTDGTDSATCVQNFLIQDTTPPTAICQDITIQLDATGNASVTAAEIDNGSSDACGAVSLTIEAGDITDFDCSDVGVPQVVTLIVTDDCGNTNSCDATVTIADDDNPCCSFSATCNLDPTITNVEGCGVSALPTPFTDENDVFSGVTSVPCGPLVLTHNDVSTGSLCPAGISIERTYTLTDGTDSATCVQNFLIQDTTPPTALCQDITIQLDATGNASITAADINDGSNDACGAVSLAIEAGDLSNFDCSHVGDQTVTLVVTDDCGNTNSCDATVTVEDNVPPTAVCQDITIQLDATGNVSITAADIDNGSSDACGNPTIAIETGDLSNFDCSHAGTTQTVTLIVTDTNGNTSSCDANVTVEDNVPPTAVCQDITIQLDAAGNASITAADIDNGSTDACGIASLTLSQENFDCTQLGPNTVTLTVTDNNGNINSCDATVTVEDNIPPTAVCQDITIQLDASGNVSITAADIDGGNGDACGNPTIAIEAGDLTNFDCSHVGTTQIVTLIVTDTNGNTSSCDASVTVEDNVPPTAVCQDITIQLDATGNVSITAADIDNGSTDACGNPTIAIETGDLTNFDCSHVGTTQTVTLIVTDTNGNTSSCDASVTVEDNVPPTAVCQDITIQLDATGNASITAADIDNGSNDACGNPTIAIETGDLSNFDCSHVGTTQIVTLIVTDVNGNTSSCDANVTVEDNVPPTAICQDITVQLDATGNVSITAADIDGGSGDACGNPTIAIETGDLSNFNCSHVGTTQTVTLIVTDTNGNTSQCDASVTVEDNVPPTAVCQDITIQLDASGNASITTADIDNGSNDACGIASLSLDQEDFDCTESGANTVTLTVTDNNGNTSTCVATVTVEDNIPPTLLTCPGDIESCSPDTPYELPTFTDNCGANIVMNNNPSGTIFPVGDTDVVIIISDDAGNMTTCEFTYTYNPIEIDVTLSDYNGYAIRCAGDNNGEATANVISGVGPFSYNWSNGQTTATATNLSPSVYTVTVTNPIGCFAVETVLITEPDPLDLDADVNNVQCPGGETGDLGSIEAFVEGGVAPYEYIWSTGGPTPTVIATGSSSISGLNAGIYQVEIADANFCEITMEFEVTEPEPLVWEEIGQNIFEGLNGQILPFYYNTHQIFLSGGTLPYNIDMEHTGYVNWAILESDNPDYETLITINYADNAEWAFSIEDANGCGINNVTFTNDSGYGGGNPSVSDDGDILDIDDFVITGESNVNSEDGSIDITVVGGDGGPYTYEWTGPNGYTSTSEDVDGLESGTYTVVVTSPDGQVTQGYYWVTLSRNGGRLKDQPSFNADLYPNIFSDFSRVYLELKTSDVVDINIIDINGKSIMNLFSDQLMPGSYEHTLDPNSVGLSNGIYFCVINTQSGYQKIVRFVFTKG